MKKQLFFFVALGVFTFSSQAQTRLSLFEEFTGENCGPCAYYNPGLQTLLNANTGKVIFIAYRVQRKFSRGYNRKTSFNFTYKRSF